MLKSTVHGSLIFGSAGSEHPRLANGEIISEEFQRMRSQSTNVTDEQTDRQTTCDRNTAVCTKVHRAVKTQLTERSGVTGTHRKHNIKNITNIEKREKVKLSESRYLAGPRLHPQSLFLCIGICVVAYVSLSVCLSACRCVFVGSKSPCYSSFNTHIPCICMLVLFSHDVFFVLLVINNLSSLLVFDCTHSITH